MITFQEAIKTLSQHRRTDIDAKTDSEFIFFSYLSLVLQNHSTFGSSTKNRNDLPPLLKIPQNKKENRIISFSYPYNPFSKECNFLLFVVINSLMVMKGNSPISDLQFSSLHTVGIDYRWNNTWTHNV